MELASREVLSFASSRRAPALARKAVREFATASGAANNADTAELLASELVTNAVTHGQGTVRLMMKCNGHGLEVTVCDDAPALPQVAEADPLALGGRGLQLVEVLADAWGITAEVGGPGKGVWFRLA